MHAVFGCNNTRHTDTPFRCQYALYFFPFFSRIHKRAEYHCINRRYKYALYTTEFSVIYMHDPETPDPQPNKNLGALVHVSSPGTSDQSV